jgi:hypothetical protein
MNSVSRGTRADQGAAQLIPGIGKLSRIVHECVRHKKELDVEFAGSDDFGWTC